MGHPLDESTLYGPVHNKAAVEAYKNTVAEAQKQGGKILEMTNIFCFRQLNGTMRLTMDCHPRCSPGMLDLFLSGSETTDRTVESSTSIRLRLELRSEVLLAVKNTQEAVGNRDQTHGSSTASVLLLH